MAVIHFTQPASPAGPSKHHSDAAMGNLDVRTHATAALCDALSGDQPYQRILLKAAAGAGKTHALKHMVAQALQQPECSRVAVTAFANKQVHPLAEGLGHDLGRDAVCLMVRNGMAPTMPDSIVAACTVVESYKDVPDSATVILATTHKFEGSARWLEGRIGPATNGSRLFDVLFVDEAWQLPLHRYRRIERLAPIAVGVGDVGQLPPLDPSANPWRGDTRYNPFRAWPTAYDEDPETWAAELPAVWRPTAAQLPLWRAFYSEWEELNCVSGPGDRDLIPDDGLDDTATAVWGQVRTGVPTLVEVAGLPEAEAADIDLPLLSTLEHLLDELLAAGFSVRTTDYDNWGSITGSTIFPLQEWSGDPLIAVLATRNQAVDDAQDMVDRLIARYNLPEGLLAASTVDSWQGRTNTLTVAIHPLSGATALDEFNSAFGRLAVTCTRATHGLLLLSRAGLDQLLTDAPARPGTPLGEPGPRQLPRQTHGRILSAFARGVLDA